MLKRQLESLFLVWGTPRQGPRSRVLTRALDMEPPVFLAPNRSRSALNAPYRYARQLAATVQLLARVRPRLVFVQSPPGFAVLAVYLYCRVCRAHYIVDAHNDTFDRAIWTRPRFLYRELARRALTTIVTNEHEAAEIRTRGGHAFIFPDPPTEYPVHRRFSLNGDFSIAVVNTFSPDEPFAQVTRAAAALDGIHLYITGDTKCAPHRLIGQAPANVTFTGFLCETDYYALLASVDVVMCLCTGQHTWQGGAGEGLWLGKPLIVSDMRILRDYFDAGTVFVANTPEGIRDGVLEMRSKHVRYQREICELRVRRRVTGQAQLGALVALIQGAQSEN